MIKIYGIKNCDTMKKALKWLDTHQVQYEFHNYKKQGVDINALKIAIEQHGWDTVINKRGTTWRQLPDDVKNTMNADKAIEIAADNPSIIKRPLLMIAGQSYLGFKDTEYKELFC